MIGTEVIKQVTTQAAVATTMPAVFMIGGSRSQKYMLNRMVHLRPPDTEQDPP